MPQDEVQHPPAAFSSISALPVADDAQLCSHFMSPLHPWMQLMMFTHASSAAHACVAEQHLAWTQLAHAPVVKTIPQAAVAPPEPPLPPLPPPPLLEPPLDPLLWLDEWHALAQVPVTQPFIPCTDERQEGLAVAFARHACDVCAEPSNAPLGQ